MTPTFDQVTAYGKKQGFYVMPQPTDALVAPVGAVATSTTGGPLRVESTDIAVTKKREKHEFSQEGRRAFVGSTYSKLTEIPVSIMTPLIPAPDLTGVPEAFHLMAAAMGSGVLNSGTNTTFGPADLAVAIRLSLARIVNVDDPIFGEWVNGFVADQFKFEWAGGSPPKIGFTGEARSIIQASRALAAASTGTTLVLQAAFPFAIQVGSRLIIDGDDNTGAGWPVAAVDATGLQYTITGASLSLSGGESVRPFMPARTYSSQPPIGAVAGSVSIGGVEVPCAGLDFTGSMGSDYIKDEIGSDAMTDAPPGDQDLGGNLTLRATQDVLSRLPKQGQFTAEALTIVCGVASPRLATWSMPQIEIDRDKLTMDSGKGTISLPYRALDSADGAADAFSLVWS